MKNIALSVALLLVSLAPGLSLADVIKCPTPAEIKITAQPKFVAGRPMWAFTMFKATTRYNGSAIHWVGRGDKDMRGKKITSVGAPAKSISVTSYYAAGQDIYCHYPNRFSLAIFTRRNVPNYHGQVYLSKSGGKKACSPTQCEVSSIK